MASGVKRAKPAERRERFSTLTFGWWFLDSPLFGRTGRDQFLRIVERQFPECLPKRYGRHEPPQYLYSETGRDHLLDFLDEHVANERDSLPIVWYPHWPAVSVSFGFPKPAGASSRGFRSNYIEIDVDHDVLAQEGWATQLRRFWLKMSTLIRPFYGDVRTLGGRIRARAGYSVDEQTEQHPIRGWWWRGIPPVLGHAFVLGAEYRRLWPAADAIGDLDCDLAFVSSDDWVGGGGVARLCGEAPMSITARPFVWPDGMDPRNAPVNTPDSYPALWPFASPFSLSGLPNNPNL
jgi:hypothetical protein